MIGRFLGTEVPAAGFSIGFERVVDLIEVPADETADSIVLVHDQAVPLDRLLAVKTELIASGRRVRLEKRTKNLKAILDRAEAAGFGAFAIVTPETTDARSLEIKALG
jgi:histidyl-tRNA synthetase